MATSNKMRALNGLPFDFEDGLKVKGIDLSVPGGASGVIYDTDNMTIETVLDTVKPLANYEALRVYSGRASQIRITDPAIAGFFYRDDSDTTSADNGGTIIRGGYFNGSTTVSGSGARWKRQYDGAIYTNWFGAKGDGITDDSDSINAAMLAAGDLATLNNNSPVKIIIPKGMYICNGVLSAQSNTIIENNGYLKFTGGNNVGHFFHISRKNNVEVYGGVFDSNDQGNDNTIAVSFNDTLPFCENIFIHNLTIKNAKHGGQHIVDLTDPAYVGTGGGKGITIQHGCKNVIVSDILIDDCDIGYSIEGKVSNLGYCNGVVINNVVVKNAKYIGALLWGSYYEPNSGSIMSAEMTNITFVNCCTGLNSYDNSLIARDFGVITCNGGGHWTLRGRVLNESGTTELIRGSHRFCKIDLDASVYNLSNIINTKWYGGFLSLKSEARYNRYKISLQTGGTITGYVFRCEPVTAGVITAISAKNYLEVDYLCYINDDPSTVGVDESSIDSGTWSGAGLFLNIDTTTQWELFNRGRGEYFRGQGIEGTEETGLVGKINKISGSQSNFFNLGIQDDKAAGITALRAGNSRHVAIRDNTGSTQLIVTVGGTTINNKLFFAKSDLVIASGAVTVTKSFHRLDTEASSAADDLDTIVNGTGAQLLMLTIVNSTRAVTVKNGTGNIHLNGDCILNHVRDTLTLVFEPSISSWLEIARSNNS